MAFERTNLPSESTFVRSGLPQVQTNEAKTSRPDPRKLAKIAKRAGAKHIQFGAYQGVALFTDLGSLGRYLSSVDSYNPEALNDAWLTTGSNTTKVIIRYRAAPPVD